MEGNVHLGEGPQAPGGGVQPEGQVPVTLQCASDNPPATSKAYKPRKTVLYFCFKWSAVF